MKNVLLAFALLGLSANMLLAQGPLFFEKVWVFSPNSDTAIFAEKVYVSSSIPNRSAGEEILLHEGERIFLGRDSVRPTQWKTSFAVAGGGVILSGELATATAPIAGPIALATAGTALVCYVLFQNLDQEYWNFATAFADQAIYYAWLRNRIKTTEASNTLSDYWLNDDICKLFKEPGNQETPEPPDFKNLWWKLATGMTITKTAWQELMNEPGFLNWYVLKSWQENWNASGGAMQLINRMPNMVYPFSPSFVFRDGQNHPFRFTETARRLSSICRSLPATNTSNGVYEWHFNGDGYKLVATATNSDHRPPGKIEAEWSTIVFFSPEDGGEMKFMRFFLVKLD